MKKSRTFTYKRIKVVVDVELNKVQKPSPEYQDTLPGHFVNAHIKKYGFDFPATVSDLNLQATIEKAEKAAKDFIDAKLKSDALTKTTSKDTSSKHLKTLTEKGFK